MNLKSDREGFLVGVPLGDADAAQTLAAIKGDTRAILAIMRSHGRGGARQGSVSARAALLGSIAPTGAVVPHGRATSLRVRDSATGRFVAGRAGPAAAASVPAARAQAAAEQVADSASALVRAQEADRQDAKAAAARERSGGQMRGADGRFGGGPGTGADGSGARFGEAGSATVEAARQVDPLLSSIGELSDLAQTAKSVASPVGRLFGKGQGGDDEKTQGGGWMRRLWREMRLMRRDSTKGSRDIAKGLREAGRGSGDGEGGIGGMLMGLLRVPLMAIAGVGVAGILGWFTGSALNKWLDSLDLGGKFSRAWSSVVDWTKELLAPVSRGVAALLDWVASLPGVKTLKAVGEGVLSGVRSSVEGLQGAGRAALGWLSKRFESGKGGAGTVSTGKGDFGGVSYGSHQLSSKTGTLQQFLNGSSYGAKFAGLTPGTPEFNAKWKEVASSDAGFGQAQRDFIERTHYQPMMDRLKRSGIDLSGRGEAVREAVFSTATQFGPNHNLIGRALAGKDAARMSDAGIVAAIQDYKITNNDRLFASSDARVRAGTLKRAHAEKGDLLALAGVGVPSMAIAAPKTRPPVMAPAQPQPLAVGSPPRLEVDVARGVAARPIVAAAPSAPPSQDVPDRFIAHVVTGGIGSPAGRR